MSLYGQVRAWMFDHALPLWLARGVDHTHGGFVEALTLDGADAAIPFKRVRVAWRQIYVFSHAAELGWSQGLEPAMAGARWMAETAWRGDGAGFVRRLDRAGAVLDPTIDLYDNAFALFAFAWLYRATKDPWALDWARRTLGAVQTTLAHPGGEGFWHDEGKAAPRQQNPHMHLIEGCLAAFEASGEAAFLAQADAIAALFARRFFDGRTLAEFFTDDWARAPGDPGDIVEPGHMLEWAWILAQHQRLAGVDHRPTIAALIDFAERHGVDPATGATFNALSVSGAVRDRGARTWPNTERLKGAVAAAEALGRPAGPQAFAAVRLLLRRYLAVSPLGGWIDAFDADGAPLAANMPASTLYHVFLAFAEFLRCEPLLGPAPATDPQGATPHDCTG